jgi:hypothetical protein
MDIALGLLANAKEAANRFNSSWSMELTSLRALFMNVESG